ncbi:MAG: protein kinase, partial [Candidatus Eisenbacteria bacterium]|nr:protein kinase [Candidatus Eisenbacteria bacterium]
MQRIGRYEVERVLGEGGMGIVYAARDPQLGRSIAIKRLRDTGDPQARERLWREARAAAGVNHPRICQVYDVWDESGELCVAMELLAGESLAERISRGPLPLAEAIETELAILDALEALHASGIVHRDVKPSNVFLTPHGVKLLDFGLALAHGGATQVGGGEEPADATRRDAMRLTAPLTIVGTRRYMAPEQWDGGTITPAADLFAAGALLFEMLTGRPAFPGDNAVAIYHGILYRDPPALAGGPEILAIDRVLQGAISRRPADRYPSAAAMAADLRRTLSSFTSPSLLAPSSSVASSAASSVASSGASSAASSGASTFPGVRPVTRLVVLPLRLLRPDPEIEFLSFSLADAVSTSLSGLESLVVRSSAAASRFAADPHPNLASIASQLGVDAVLFGTLLRAGDQVRVSVQLVEAPAGTLLWSKTAQVGLRDLFQLQDDLAHEIVASLHIPLRSQSREAIARDVPVDPTAYQLYLRATDVGCSTISRSVLTQARDLYLASLEQDPGYAPAWARLGRIYRVMAKYDHGDATENIRLAGEAFRKALALNPAPTPPPPPA